MDDLVRSVMLGLIADIVAWAAVLAVFPAFTLTTGTFFGGWVIFSFAAFFLNDINGG